MKNYTYLRLVLTIIFVVLVLALLALWGRDRAAVPTAEPTATASPTAQSAETAAEPTSAPAAKEAPAEAAEEEGPESPLSAPDSPLAPESPISSPESPLVTPTPIPAPDPQAGAASVVGRLVNTYTRQPLTNTVVRLAEILCPDEFDENAGEAKMRDDCVFKLDNAFSPSAITDEDGVFIFENVDPKNYVLFVGDYMVEFTLANNENGSPVIYTVDSDKVLQLDEIAVEF
jgi:hypothetical protein